MKQRMCLWVVLCLSFLLTGCELVFQAGTGRGAGFYEYQKSIKPYLHYWDKPDMTHDGRLEDWVECGGQSNGDWGPTIKKTNEEKRPNESGTDAAYERLSDEFQRCILKRGYHYTGMCDSKVMRAKPACGAQ